MTLRQKYTDALAQISTLKLQLAQATADLAACVADSNVKDTTIDALNADVAWLQAQVLDLTEQLDALQPAGTHILGAWTEMGGDGVWTLAESQQFDVLSGGKMAASMHYATWMDSGIAAELQSSYNAGRTLVHTAWPAKNPRPTDIVAGVISGKYDAIIATIAQQFETARAGRKMHWRPFWEMNGSWQPWNASFTGNDPGKYRAMFQRVVAVGREAGYGGKFVWSPNAYSTTKNAWDTLDAYYPGDDVTDICGVSGYNGYTANGVPWREFSTVIADIQRVAEAHDKPLCWSEGSSIEDPQQPGRKAAWIRNMNTYILATPRWETMLWFHRPGVTWDALKDYRVDSSQSSLDAWRELVAGAWPNG